IVSKMALFSERNGYTKPSDIIIREKITPEIQNAMCSCYDRLVSLMPCDGYDVSYIDMEKHIWTFFLNERESKFYIGHTHYRIVATAFIEDKERKWYEKLDLLEFTIKYLRERVQKRNPVLDKFINRLNSEFERLNFGYRIVNDEVVEITSEVEIKAIEDSLKSTHQNIRMHLDKALQLYAKRPDGDYSNSIKESISAVEAYCRERTGKSTLGDALKNLESKGIVIPKALNDAFTKLYIYTNQPDTGIRHALMDTDGKYTPKAEEALFMLVSCSAFISYLMKK
ncbi:MAG: hypothetical protein LUC91_03645, partial [Prevotella sp.]|nr:hypothetical protein [Prevotella sp.]